MTKSGEQLLFCTFTLLFIMSLADMVAIKSLLDKKEILSEVNIIFS
jgi:hypothetical protein